MPNVPNQVLSLLSIFTLGGEHGFSTYRAGHKPMDYFVYSYILLMVYRNGHKSISFAINEHTSPEDV